MVRSQNLHFVLQGDQVTVWRAECGHLLPGHIIGRRLDCPSNGEPYQLPFALSLRGRPQQIFRPLPVAQLQKLR